MPVLDVNLLGKIVFVLPCGLMQRISPASFRPSLHSSVMLKGQMDVRSDEARVHSSIVHYSPAGVKMALRDHMWYSLAIYMAACQRGSLQIAEHGIVLLEALSVLTLRLGLNQIAGRDAGEAGSDFPGRGRH